jgi:hypothetical protein
MSTMGSLFKQPSANTKFIGLFIFILSFGGLMLVESLLRPDAIAGVYFHGIPSESMMQTVSIIDLRDQPWISLWNIHIQPPLFDLMRAALANFSGSNDPLILQYQVDQGIYLIWAIAYGLICTFIYLWLSKLTNDWWALIATLFFAASPAALLYATLLETTLLSSLLILILIFLLWKISQGDQVSPWLLALSFLALFFTRSVFQWPWIILLVICLVIMRYPVGLLKKFIIIACLIVFLFLTKQFLLFGISSTSSFSGLNLCQSIAACKSHYIPEQVFEAESDLPKVLTRDKKLTDAHNFNHLVDLQLNQAYLQDYKEKLGNETISNLFSIYWKNISIYFQPSSNYAGTNQLLVYLPERWRIYYEKIFSAPIFPALLIFCTLFWLKNHHQVQRRKAIGVCLPIMAIFAISVLFESGENMRFKFFIEPVLFIFIASQIYLAGQGLWNFLHRQKTVY